MVMVAICHTQVIPFNVGIIAACNCCRCRNYHLMIRIRSEAIVIFVVFSLITNIVTIKQYDAIVIETIV